MLELAEWGPGLATHRQTLAIAAFLRSLERWVGMMGRGGEGRGRPALLDGWGALQGLGFDLICNAQRRVSARLPMRPLHPGTKEQPAA